MIELLIVGAVVLALVAASAWADRRFRGAERLPMQWSFGGNVNWTAPRRIALAFTPALAAVTMGGVLLLILLSGDPRPGQEGMGPPVLLFVGLMFLAVHALHLWLIDRSVR
jgi:hypothetical protein